MWYQKVCNCRHVYCFDLVRSHQCSTAYTPLVPQVYIHEITCIHVHVTTIHEHFMLHVLIKVCTCIYYTYTCTYMSTCVASESVLLFVLRTTFLSSTTSDLTFLISAPYNTVRYPMLHTVRYPVLHTVRYPMLHTVRYPMLHTVRYPVLHTVRYPMLHTVRYPMLQHSEIPNATHSEIPNAAHSEIPNAAHSEIPNATTQ